MLDPEIEDKAFRQQAIAKLERCKWEMVDSENLRKILEVLGGKL